MTVKEKLVRSFGHRYFFGVTGDVDFADLALVFGGATCYPGIRIIEIKTEVKLRFIPSTVVCRIFQDKNTIFTEVKATPEEVLWYISDKIFRTSEEYCNMGRYCADMCNRAKRRIVAMYGEDFLIDDATERKRGEGRGNRNETIESAEDWVKGCPSTKRPAKNNSSSERQAPAKPNRAGKLDHSADRPTGRPAGDSSSSERKAPAKPIRAKKRTHAADRPIGRPTKNSSSSEAKQGKAEKRAGTGGAS